MFEINFDEVIKMIEGWVENLEHPDKILEKSVGPVLRASADQQFRAGGYPDKWKPLRRSTVQDKYALGYPRRNRFGEIPYMAVQNGRFGPHNILIRTTSLRSSWTQESNPFHICKAKDGILTFGSDLSYAVFHQSTKPRKRLPRRPIVIDPATLQECANAFVAAVISTR